MKIKKDIFEERKRLKESIKQGSIVSLLTYLKELEQDSLIKYVAVANDHRFYQSRIQTIQEIILLLNK